MHKELLLPARYTSMWYASSLAWTIMVENYFGLDLGPAFIFGVPVAVMLGVNLVNYYHLDESTREIKREYLTEAMGWAFVVLMITLALNEIVFSQIQPLDMIEVGFWSWAAAFSIRTVYEQYGREIVEERYHSS